MPLAKVVCRNATEGAQGEHREKTERQDNAKLRSRTGQCENEPHKRHYLHPCSHLRNALPEEKETVVAYRKRCERLCTVRIESIHGRVRKRNDTTLWLDARAFLGATRAILKRNGAFCTQRRTFRMRGDTVCFRRVGRARAHAAFACSPRARIRRRILRDGGSRIAPESLCWHNLGHRGHPGTFARRCVRQQSYSDDIRRGGGRILLAPWLHRSAQRDGAHIAPLHGGGRRASPAPPC